MKARLFHLATGSVLPKQGCRHLRVFYNSGCILGILWNASNCLQTSHQTSILPATIFPDFQTLLQIKVQIKAFLIQKDRILEKKLREKFTCWKTITALRDMRVTEAKDASYIPSYTHAPDGCAA